MAKGLTEAQWEKKLNIRTLSARHEKDDKNHSRYEPTPYGVLERLAASGLIGQEDLLVDYGSGKGRVGFFLTGATGCRSLGVEYDPRMHAFAMENLSGYIGKRDRIRFICENAETAAVHGATCFYFFNPFSEKILLSVLNRIYESYYECPRRMRLFFYYATDSYRTLMMNDENLVTEGEIDCMDLFPGADEKEKILIFTVG